MELDTEDATLLSRVGEDVTVDEFLDSVTEDTEEIGIDKTPVVATLNADELEKFLDTGDDFTGGREAAKRAREEHTPQKRID